MSSLKVPSSSSLNHGKPGLLACRFALAQDSVLKAAGVTSRRIYFQRASLIVRLADRHPVDRRRLVDHHLVFRVRLDSSVCP